MKLIILIFAFYHGSNAQYHREVSFEHNFPFERHIVYPFQTYGLVEFQSKDAKPITVPPISIKINPHSQLLMNKTTGGRARLRATPIDNNATITLTGGVVFDDEYVLDRFVYLLDGTANGHVGGIVDGESKPLEYGLMFRKKIYKTVDEAVNNADGFVELAVPVRVVEGPDNMDFESMEKILYQMRSPNASAIIVSTEEAAGWLLKSLTRYNAFYSYPVIFENNLNPFQPLKQCVIRLQPAIPRNQYPCISKRQFSEYLRVLNYNGKPLTFTLPTFPLGERPLVKAYTRILLTSSDGFPYYKQSKQMQFFRGFY